MVGPRVLPFSHRNSLGTSCPWGMKKAKKKHKRYCCKLKANMHYSIGKWLKRKEYKQGYNSSDNKRSFSLNQNTDRSYSNLIKKQKRSFFFLTRT